MSLNSSDSPLPLERPKPTAAIILIVNLFNAVPDVWREGSQPSRVEERDADAEGEDTSQVLRDPRSVCLQPERRRNR